MDQPFLKDYHPGFNTSGTFVSGTFAAIAGFKMTATGMGEQANANIEMYPNPTSDMLNISDISEKINVTIFNVFGEEVYQSEVSASTGINVGSFAKGTYLVKLTTSNGNIINKLVIK